MPNSRMQDKAASSVIIRETKLISSERHHDPIFYRFRASCSCTAMAGYAVYNASRQFVGGEISSLRAVK